MTAYLARRILQSVLVLLGLIIVVFFVTQVLGDPVRLMLPPEAPLSVYYEMRTAMGYDDPLPIQFVRFMSRAVIGDFGVSIWQKVPVLPLVLGRLPATALLAFMTIGVGVAVAVPIGVTAAARSGSVFDRLATALSLVGVCIPGFWLALVLILVFAVTLRWLPTSGYGDWKFLVLPVLALVLRFIGRSVQLVRTSVLDEMGKAYLTAARAKGLHEPTILSRHVFKNAAIPVFTLIAGELLSLLNGAIVVESIFAWPGLGLLTIQAILNRDLPLLQGTVVVHAFLVVLLNLVLDLGYASIDPRIKLEQQPG